MIENEIRGRLTKAQYERLIERLEKDAEKIKEFRRFSIRYEPENFRTSKFDLRVRTQEDKTEIILKLGSYDDPHRQEIPVLIKQDSLENAIKLLAEMGYKYGFAMWRFTKLYKYKRVEISVSIAPHHSYYFELEVLSTKDKQKEALENMHKVKEELNLPVFENTDDLYEFFEDLDDNANLTFNYGEIDLDKLLNPDDEVWKKPGKSE
ncbi:CYTH domain-containing protein [Candidatus Dojkabacteria bacterium]|nr:CYTH domain-containing protein [Candidatus Dojkabacteria bacterium]